MTARRVLTVLLLMALGFGIVFTPTSAQWDALLLPGWLGIAVQILGTFVAGAGLVALEDGLDPTPDDDAPLDVGALLRYLLPYIACTGCITAGAALAFETEHTAAGGALFLLGVLLIGLWRLHLRRSEAV